MTPNDHIRVDAAEGRRCRKCRDRIINAGISAMAIFVKAEMMDDGPGKAIGEELTRIVDEPVQGER